MYALAVAHGYPSLITFAVGDGEGVHSEHQGAHREDQQITGIEQVSQNPGQQAPGHAGEGFDGQHRAHHVQRDPPLGQVRRGEAGHGGQADDMSEIGGHQDVELWRARRLGEGPGFLGPMAAGAVQALGLGVVSGHPGLQSGCGALQPCRSPGHQGACRADRQSHNRLDHPQPAPVVMEQVQQADDGEGARRAEGGGQGEIEAQDGRFPPEQGCQHVVGRDERHHLIADAAKSRADEVHGEVVRDAEDRQSGGDAQGAEEQGRPHAEPADQDRGHVGRSADTESDDGEAHSGFGPIPGLVVDHQRQGDAQGRIDADRDQALQEAEHSQHRPGTPFHPKHQQFPTAAAAGKPDRGRRTSGLRASCSEFKLPARAARLCRASITESHSPDMGWSSTSRIRRHP